MKVPPSSPTPLLLLLLSLALPAFGRSARPIFVDQDAAPGGDGTRWSSAYQSVHDALARAGNGDEIWLAEGIYYPDEGGGNSNNDVTASFVIPGGVTLIGGFSGNEDSVEESQPEIYSVLLSGDLEQNDVDSNNDGIPNLPFTPVGLNSYHVVTIENNTKTSELRGLTVVAGDVPDGSQGGGIRAINSDFVLDSVNVRVNRATGIHVNGAGISVSGGNLVVLRSSSITDNRANRGGGLYLSNLRVLQVEGSDINRNEATARGAGIWSSNTAIQATDTDLRRNEVTGAGLGGALYASNNGEVRFELLRCRVENNFAGGNGGAFWIEQADFQLTNCRITANESGSGFGGAIYSTSSSTRYVNCLFAGNRAALTGGAFSHSDANDFDFDIVNCTLVNNRANFLGVGFATSWINSIVWDNITDTPTSSDVNGNSYTHCLIEGLDLSGSNGNLDGASPLVTPGFAAPSTDPPPTDQGNYELTALSSVLDAGDNAAYTGPLQDLLPRIRILDGDGDLNAVIDLGAYEFGVSNIQDVDNDGLPDSYERLHANGSPTALDPLVDYDTDGLDTLLEYALGPNFNPNTAEPLTPVTITVNAQNRAVLNFSFRPSSAQFVDFIVESSTDAGRSDPWNTADMTINFTDIGADQQVGIATGNAEITDVRLFRLRVVKKP